MMNFDTVDRRLLAELQRDASQSVDILSETVGLSRNAVWRRIRALEEAGVIRARVALVDPVAVGLGLIVFISVKTSRHDAAWAAQFAKALSGMDEVLGFYRTSGAQDYLIKARVADVPAYDRLYKRLIAKVDLSDVSASFVMEAIKETTALPVR